MRQMALAASVQSSMADGSLTLALEEVRTLTSSGTPPPRVMASWLVLDLRASCVMTRMVLPLASVDAALIRFKSGVMPPASTMLFRLSVESRARLARAAAACSWAAALPVS